MSNVTFRVAAQIQYTTDQMPAPAGDLYNETAHISARAKAAAGNSLNKNTKCCGSATLEKALRCFVGSITCVDLVYVCVTT